MILIRSLDLTVCLSMRPAPAHSETLLQSGSKAMSKVAKTLRASNDDVKKTKKISVFTSLNNWIKVSGITRSLYQLDDRTLDDLGLSRDEIPSYAKKLVQQDNQSAA